MKKCKKCNIEKPLNCFNKNSNQKDKLHVWCKECSSINNKKRYNTKKDEIKHQTLQYYNNNKDIILPKLKIYRDKDEIKTKQKEYIKNWVKENKEYYREYQNNYQKERLKSDPQFRTVLSLRNQIYMFLKDKGKNEKTEKLLGYSYKDFIEKIGFKEPDQEIDHKIPISWFKENTPINIIWDLDNLQLISKKLNRVKKDTFSTKISIEYYKKIEEWINPLKLQMISTYV